MRNFVLQCLIVAFLGASGAGQAAWATSDSPEALDGARRDALALIGSGQRLEAANLLLKSLREIPPDRPDLASPAVGAVQVLLFDTEYLMQREERTSFYAQSLDETGHPIDLLLATLMRFSDDAGISVEEAGRCAKDLFSLTQGQHRAIRLGALYIMSDPYYFYDTDWAGVARNQIARDFPGTELAEEAQRLVLFRAHQLGPEGFRAAFNLKEKDGSLRALSQRLRADAVGSVLYGQVRVSGVGKGDAACATALAAVAAATGKCTEEYAALNIMADLDKTAASSEIRAAATAAIERNNNPRAVFRARTLRLDLARAEGDPEAILEDVRALLAVEDIPLVPERNNYEELMNHVRQSAERLAGLGRAEEARGLLRRLADRFPGSALAIEVEAKIGSIAEVGAGGAAN